MWTIAGLTGREIVYRRVFHLALLLTGIFLLLYGAALYFGYKNPVKDPIIRNIMATQLTSVGLYLSSFIVAFLAVLASVGSISGELESGVIQSILVKPIHRWEFVLGRYLGLAMILFIYAAGFFIAVIGLNYYFGRGTLPIYIWNAFKAMGFYVSLPLILLSLSLWGSAFLPTLNNGVMVVMLYSLATVGGIVEQVGRLITSDAMVNMGIVTSLILPVDAIYRKMSNTLFLAAPGNLTVLWDSFLTGKHEPSFWMFLYTGVYVIFFLGLAVRIFGRRDI